MSSGREEILSPRALDAVSTMLVREGKDFADVRAHAVRVESNSARLARYIGMTDAVVSKVQLAARLHDVGKMLIPVTIQRKKGRLDDAERSVMETHADKGALMLSAVPGMPKDIVDTARYHHERYDGFGYFGLAGEEIPYTSRIVAVADVYDALVSARDYKPEMPEGQALSIMTADTSGKTMGRRAFDPFLLRSFVKMRLADNVARFSDEERAALTAYSSSHPMTDLPPDVRSVEIDPDGERRMIDDAGQVVSRLDAAGEAMDIPQNRLSFG